MIPDYCEALTAYRCWNVFPNGLLVGQAHAEPWQPFAPFVGRCGHAISGDHIKDGAWVPAPVYGCDCGVHALKSEDDAEARIITESDGWAFSVSYYPTPKGRVWGAVKLWGRVIEHAIGYRAEFAYPSALCCEDEKLAGVVAALYGVPCEVKTLDRQKPLNDADSGLSIRFISNWNPTSYYLSSRSLWAAPAPTQPSVVQPATLAQVKALGSSRHQKKAAATAIAQKEEAAAKKRDLIAAYLAKGATKIDVEVEA